MNETLNFCPNIPPVAHLSSAMVLNQFKSWCHLGCGFSNHLYWQVLLPLTDENPVNLSRAHLGCRASHVGHKQPTVLFSQGIIAAIGG